MKQGKVLYGGYSLPRAIRHRVESMRFKEQLIPSLASIVLIAITWGLAQPPHASAATRAHLGSFGTQLGAPAGHVSSPAGIAVNRLGAGEVEAGAVYVSDSANDRVDVFSRTGEFIEAFGWDVVARGANDSNVNEQQSVTVPPTVSSGTFTLAVVTGTGTGVITSGSTEVGDVENALGSFHVGDSVSGTGIPSGAVIEAVSASSLTLSAPATSGEQFARTLTATEDTAPIAFDATPDQLAEALGALPGVGLGNVTVANGSGEPYLITFSGGLLAGDDLAQMSAEADFVGGSAVVATVSPGGAFERCNANATPTDFCKSGSRTGAAGAIGSPQGIAVDQDSGMVFVASAVNRRIDVFSAAGDFQGAFGLNVVPGGAVTFEFCNTSSGCQAAPAPLSGAPTGAAGAFANLSDGGLAVDPNSGNLYVTDQTNRRVNVFSVATDGVGEVEGAAFVQAFGWNVVPGGAIGLETCTAASGCQSGAAGGGDGQFGTASPNAVAAELDGSVLVVSRSGASCGPNAPCRVQEFGEDGSFVREFGPESGECQVNFSGLQTGSEVQATAISVDPASGHVLVVKKVDDAEAVVCELDSAGNEVARFPSPSLQTNHTPVGLALGEEDAVYVGSRLSDERGAIYRLGPAPPPVVELVAISDVGESGARFEGRVAAPAEIDGVTFETRWRFEISTDQADWQPVSIPDKSAGSAPELPVDVEDTARGLRPNTAYFVRLCGITGQPTCSPAQSFRTDRAAPTVLTSYAREVTKTSGLLGAEVRPNGRATSYHIEWGTSPGQYSDRTPPFSRSIGDGAGVVFAAERIDGLAPGTKYYFRVVASNFCHPVDSADSSDPNSPCVTVGPDTSVETLNECGFINNRCLELVSPSQKVPGSGAADTVGTGKEFRFQAGRDEGRIVYEVAFGLGDATAGGEVLYRGERGNGEWTASQLTPASVQPTSTNGGSAQPVQTLGFSSDLSCAVMASAQPLAPGAPAATVEAGYTNLFIVNETGAARVITESPPANLGTVTVQPRLEYVLVGIADDCDTVAFSTKFAYRGLDGSGEDRLYIWSAGEGLKSVGNVPGAAEEMATVVTAPGAVGGRNSWQALSSSGKRLFFSAERRRGDGPAGGAEVGEFSVFAHEEGGTVLDLSQSTTEVPSRGAYYQAANVDGSKVFFLSNSGLRGTAPTDWPAECVPATGAGCTLYEYDFSKPIGERLKDMSGPAAAGSANGPGVVTLASLSKDGDRLYFAARAQLVPERGPSEGQNELNDTYSLYHAGDEGVAFIGVVGASDLATVGINTVSASSRWTAQTTPAGEHFLFEARENVTGQEDADVLQLYLYSAGDQETVCVSCRRDGVPPSLSDHPLLAGGTMSSAGIFEPPLAISNDGQHVFFLKSDALATGAVEGERSLYEWDHGQVSYLGTSGLAFFRGLEYVGSSASAMDVYFATTEPLTWQDLDARMDIYDARQGGGFVAPAPPAAPCDPGVEGSCQQQPTPPGPLQSPGSAVFHGPGNVSGASSGRTCPKGKRAAGARKGKRQKGKRQKGKRCVEAPRCKSPRGKKRAGCRTKKGSKHGRDRGASHGRRAGK